MIDDLTYAYDLSDVAVTNRLLGVSEASSTVLGFKKPNTGGAGYTYDNNGNRLTNGFENITGTNYLFLNLPYKVTYGTSGDSIMWTYDATEKTYLDELVEEDGQKIFFVSAYQSASKGLNPIIKNKKGEQKDFDSLVLLMDSYYTAMGPALYKAQDAGHAVTAYHFSLMKSIVHLGDSNLEIKDFNKYLSQPEAERIPGPTASNSARQRNSTSHRKNRATRFPQPGSKDIHQ